MRLTFFLKASKLYLLALIIILGTLFYTNYSPGTWLTGWDNLHPEFNFKLNIHRALYSVWQEYQGLGLLAGMAHASDLVRTLFLGALSPLIPAHLSRYFYHFLMLATGTLGIFFFLKNIVLSHQKKDILLPASFLGALLYLLNLGSIQYFYVPFEPYSTFWGLFPWEMYTLFHYIKQPTRRNLLLLAGVNLLASPQAYVQTIFFVYAMCVGIILTVYFLQHRSRQVLLAVIQVIAVIFIVNAFWILPQFYFVISDLSVTKNAMQNRMATEKFFQMNKQRGTIENFIYLKEFYYDFLDTNLKSGRTEFMMDTWRNHFEQISTSIIGFFIFCIILIGLVTKNIFRKYFLLLFGLAIFGFLSDTPGITQLNGMIRDIPVINQIFRNPFTKLIVPTVFIFAVGFGLGISYIYHSIKSQKLHLILTILLSVGIMTYVLPAFQGEYISPRMRVKIPDQYFELFNYLQQQDKNARIMNLPQGGYWGWYLYNWGARGSGFLWYGIEQPIMDRAFDVWSDELEAYYWELSTALRKHDNRALDDIIDKYAISYILYDDSLLNSDPFNPVKLAYKQGELLDQNKNLKLEKKFGSVRLYKVMRKQNLSNNIVFTNDLPSVQRKEKYSYTDLAFQELGTYANADANSFDYAYPFESLFTNRFSDEHIFSITETNKQFKFSAPLPKGSYTLEIPSYIHEETLIPVSVYARNSKNGTDFRIQSNMPVITINGKPLSQQIVFNKEFIVASSDKGLFVSINNRDSFPAENLSSTFKPIGYSYLFANGTENTIKVYSRDNATSVPLIIPHFSPPHICGDIKGEPIATSKKTNTSITLEARNTAVCQVYGSALNFTKPSLIEMQFTYHSTSDEFPRYCFYSENNRNCLNNKDIIKYGFSNKKNSRFIDRFEFFTTQKDVLHPQLILEALRDEDRNKIKKTTYQDMYIVSYPLIHTETIDSFPKSDIERSTEEIHITNLSNLEIHVSKYDTSISYPHLISSHLYKTTAFTYDSFFEGEYTLKEKQRSEGTYLELSANKASSYVLFQAPYIPFEYSYMLSLQTRNKKGLPPSINLFTNKELRNFTYSSLLSTPDKFGTDYRILPSGDMFDSGLSILINSTAYTHEPSVNDIAEVSIYPIPLNFISSFKISQNADKEFVTRQINPKVEKKNVYKYTVSIPSGSENHYIVLDQSFHTGWTAIYRCNWFLLGCKALPHVKINNWANGWKIPDTISPEVSNITIVFWPQYLEFAGFAIFLSATIIYIINSIRTLHRSKKHFSWSLFIFNMRQLRKRTLSIRKEEV